MLKVGFQGADLSGCNWYRINQPRTMLLRKNLIECLDDKFPNPLSDVIIWQRQLSEECFYYKQQYKDCVHIFELDDNIWDVPPHLYDVERFYSGRRMDKLVEFAKSCRYGVTTNNEMRKLFVEHLGFNKRDVFVIPNYMDFDLINYGKKSKDGKIRIAWTADARRANTDFLPFELFEKLLDKYPNLELLFFGGIPIDFQGMNRVTNFPFIPPKEYLQKLRLVPIDIGIAPMVDNAFNRCKSELKVLEFGALGVPVVCSDLYKKKLKYYHSNADVIRPVKYEDVDSWERHLCTLIENETIRREEGLRLHNYVRENYSLEYNGVNDYMAMLNYVASPVVHIDEKAKESISMFVSTRVETNEKVYELTQRMKKNKFQHDVSVYVAANKGGTPLGRVYNNALIGSSDTLVFCHDDIDIHDELWVEKVIEGLKKYDIVGVAGSSYYNVFNGSWFASKMFQRGTVAHPALDNPNVWGFTVYGAAGEAVVLDGVFMATTKKVLKDVMFDVELPFHFYDIDFCLRAYEKGYKIGVVPMKIFHKSHGSYRKDWADMHVKFAEKRQGEKKTLFCGKEQMDFDLVLSPKKLSHFHDIIFSLEDSPFAHVKEHTYISLESEPVLRNKFLLAGFKKEEERDETRPVLNLEGDSVLAPEGYLWVNQWVKDYERLVLPFKMLVGTKQIGINNYIFAKGTGVGEYEARGILGYTFI